MQSAPESYELRDDMPEYDTSRPTSHNQYEDDGYAESSTLLDTETSAQELPSRE